MSFTENRSVDYETTLTGHGSVAAGAVMMFLGQSQLELDRTHTQGIGCERLFYCIRVDPRRSEGEKKTKNC